MCCKKLVQVDLVLRTNSAPPDKPGLEGRHMI